MTEPVAGRIVVVGSANLDLVVEVPRHPVKGETILGGDHRRIPGGKGANQAVAASRLGAEVAFIGLVGDDPAGDQLTRSLDEAGVDTGLLGRTSVAPSGVAMITVDEKGDNAIVVSPGANSLVTASFIDDNPAAAAAIGSAAALLLQLETPIDGVRRAAELGTGLVLLDPAPAPTEPLPDDLLASVTVLVPNETELGLLSGSARPPEHVDDIAAAARSLGVETVVVTIGARGAVVVTPDDTTAIDAPAVSVVDTTAAGDAFRAALAVSLIGGASLIDATRWAVEVGAATVMVAGAQPSLPTSAEVRRRLAS